MPIVGWPLSEGVIGAVFRRRALPLGDRGLGSKRALISRESGFDLLGGREDFLHGSVGVHIEPHLHSQLGFQSSSEGESLLGLVNFYWLFLPCETVDEFLDPLVESLYCLLVALAQLFPLTHKLHFWGTPDNRRGFAQVGLERR